MGIIAKLLGCTLLLIVAVVALYNGWLGVTIVVGVVFLGILAPGPPTPEQRQARRVAREHDLGERGFQWSFRLSRFVYTGYKARSAAECGFTWDPTQERWVHRSGRLLLRPDEQARADKMHQLGWRWSAAEERWVRRFDQGPHPAEEESDRQYANTLRAQGKNWL